MINFKSFRFRLLSQFLLLILLSLMFSWLVHFFERKKEQILAMSSYLTRTHVLIIQGLKMQNEFYSYETSNPKFFTTHESEYLYKFNSISKQVNERLEGFYQLNYFHDFQLTGRIDLIRQELEHNQSLFVQLEKLIYKRGFKDWGVEGEMRNHVHQLEGYPDVIDPSKLLSLRRHEKDFILRNDSQYVKKLHKVMGSIVNDLQRNDQLFKPLRNNVLMHLDAYKEKFNELVILELKIGQKTNSGLIRKLNETNEVLNSYFFQALLQTQKREKELLAHLYYYFALTFALFLLIGLRFSFVISRRVTEPLSVLSSSLTNFVSSNFSTKSKFTFLNRNDEIGTLAKNVKILEEEIFDQINFFNHKVEEKTMKVQQQNAMILEQNTQIEFKNEVLQKQNEQIEKQKTLVENHNQRLLDSIRYAKRIQSAILPDTSITNRLLPKHFIFYQPKDIVSGDFYWVEQAKGGVFVSAVDCTGHGVPGAFMSVLGYTTLNDAVREIPQGKPGEILDYLHKNVVQIFDKNGTLQGRIHDGMDLSLIRFDNDFKRLEFAGAYNSLFVVREIKKGKFKSSVGKEELNTIVNNGYALYEIRGNRFAIGHEQHGLHFSSHAIELKKGDRIYITTDGYTDQFGGPKSRRFQKKRFRELLLELGVVAIEDQLPLLKQNYYEWKGEIEQIDDICVIGMQV